MPRKILNGLVVRGDAGNQRPLEVSKADASVVYALQYSGNSLDLYYATGGVVALRLNTDGSLLVPVSIRAPLQVINQDVVGTIPLTIKGISSQSGDLIQLKDSTGAVLTRFNNFGYPVFGDGSTDKAYIDGSNGFYRGGGATNFVNTGAYLDFNSGIGIRGRTIGEVSLYVLPVAAQTADLQQWQNSGGSVLAKVDIAGLGDFSVAGLRTKHEAGATPTGASSGELRVGTNKIWYQDAGTWKSISGGGVAVTSSAPPDVGAGIAAAAGVGVDAARSDHVHRLSYATMTKWGAD